MIPGNLIQFVIGRVMPPWLAGADGHARKVEAVAVAAHRDFPGFSGCCMSMSGWLLSHSGRACSKRRES